MKSSWAQRRVVWTLGCLLIILVPVLPFAIAQGWAFRPVCRGLLTGAELLILILGGAEVLVPSRVIRWRATMLVGGLAMAQGFAERVDRAIGMEDAAADRVKRRVRLVGVAVLVIGTACTYFVWRLIEGS